MKQVRKVLIAGMPGTGKSTLARSLAKMTGNGSHIVIEPDELGDGWAPYGYQLIKPVEREMNASGLKRVVFDEDDKTFLDKLKNSVFNQVIIFDDAVFMLTDMHQYLKLRKILGRARQTGNHIFFTIHDVADVPAPFWAYFTDVILFKTAGEMQRAKYKIPQFEKVEQARQIVNQETGDIRKFIFIKIV